MMNLSVIYKIIVLAALAVNAVMDLKENTVMSVFFLIAAATGFFLGGNKILCLLTIISVLVVRDIPGVSFGGGDIDAILITFSALGRNGFAAIIIACIIAVVFFLVTGRKNDIPFVTFICIGYAAVFAADILSGGALIT